jgi:hypothetical protein
MGMILDIMDHVAELKTLDAPPFPIEYCYATLHDPIVDESKIRVNVTDYQPFVALIKDLKCRFDDAVNPQPITTHTSPRHVSFGSHAINAIPTVHSDCHSHKHGLIDHDILFYHDQHMGSGPDE